MNYPAILLPLPSYKEVICDLSTFFLLRTTDSKDLLDSSSETLKDNAIAIDDSHLLAYSTNLLGHYSASHCEINFLNTSNKAYFHASWDFQSEVSVPEVTSDFIFDKNKGFFLLPICEFDGKRIPFKKGDSTIEYQAELKIVHKPTNSNFWHFELTWFQSNGDECFTPIKPSKSTWQKQIIGTMKSLIRQYCSLIVPKGIQPISIEFYSKN
ncbi:MAG: hypothetical protein AB7V36_09675 [Bacteroidales bacterium]